MERFEPIALRFPGGYNVWNQGAGRGVVENRMIAMHLAHCRRLAPEIRALVEDVCEAHPSPNDTTERLGEIMSGLWTLNSSYRDDWEGVSKHLKAASQKRISIPALARIFLYSIKPGFFFPEPR